MNPLRNTPPQDKAVVRHHGALGDFFLLWPALAALAARPWPGGLFWAGHPDRLGWLEPLGFRPCPAGVLRALDGLFAEDASPAVRELEGHALFWPVLDKAPPLDPRSGARFLYALAGDDPVSVRRRYLEGVAAPGFEGGDWLERFRSLFASGRAPGRQALLFPGAGHVRKQWPLVQYFQLARMLASRGLEPVFVLGPAELDRGLDPAPWPVATPADDRELAALLLAARLVVGGDCGPLHLAGMLGVSGAALFGPTDPAVWAPAGLTVVRSGLGCQPCTRDCSDLDCARPRCLEGISAAEVAEALGISELQ